MTAEFVDSSGASLRVERAHIREPIAMVWVIDLALVDEPAKLSGSCEFRLGGAVWKGTIDPSYSGAWGGRGMVRIIAGAGGWGKTIDRRGYHSDSGVKGKTVATEAASACGETLGSFAGETVLPVDYARPTGIASVTLEDVCGDASWWVDRAGVTHVGTRVAASYPGLILDWDPSSRVATLECEDLTILAVGATLTDKRLGGPQQIRELEVIADGSTVRALAWCGVAGSPMGRIPRLLSAIVQRLTEGRLWGKYEYRVVSMASDGRVNLQVVRKAVGLPDLLPIDMWPGVAGSHSELADGARVLVEFIEGDRGRPIISNFTPKSGGGFVPTRLTFGTKSTASNAARKGDTVRILLPPMVFNGTIGGSPATGVLASMTGSTLGTIESGSSEVDIGG